MKACGGYWAYEDITIFSPEFVTQKNSAYFRELFTSIKLGETNHRNHFNESNVDYWYSFFNQNVTKKDLDSILYSYSIAHIDQLIFELKGKEKNEYSKTNTIKSITNIRKAKSFLYYIGFAKRCESVNKRAYYWWDEEGKNELPPNKIEKLIKGALSNVTSNKFPKIRERYLMQITRLHFALSFHKKYKSTTTNLNADQFLKTKEIEFGKNSVNYNRAKSYAAGALRREGKVSKANLYYAQLHQIDLFKNIAQLSYKLQTEKNFYKTLSLSHNKRDSIALWKLQGIEFNDLKAAKAIYKINPKAEELNLFLTRLVNRFEEDLNFSLPSSANLLDSTNNLLYRTKNYSIQGAHNLFRFIQLVASKNNTTKPYAWHAAAGYLASVLQKSKIAKEHLNQAAVKAPKNSLVQAQLKLLEVVYQLESINDISSKNKETLIKDLKWLTESENHPKELRYEAATAYVLRKLSYLHVQSNNPYLAQLTSPYFEANLYNAQKHLDSIIKAIRSKNPWNAFLANQYPFDENDLKVAKGVLFFYQEQIDSAAKYFENSRLGVNDRISDIIFETNTKDCIECWDKKTESKSTFIAKVQEIKLQIRQSKDLDKNYYKLANAYYNTSYFGNHRGFASEVFLQNPELSFYYPNLWMAKPEFYYYLQNDIALKYFNLAAQHSKDPEFIAKCMFRAAKCEQNNWIRNHGDQAPYNGTKKYFNLLKQKYSHTDYFQEIIRECGYFKSYINE
jgi:hypothetical protein